MVRRDGRDLGWAAMVEVGTRMSANHRVRVKAVRRRDRHGIAEGIAVPSLDAFEPVRCRGWFSRHWYEVQPVQDAASRIGARLR